MSKTTTKATIDANIKQNGVQAITGPVLNTVLNAMVDDYATQEEATSLASEVNGFSFRSSMAGVSQFQFLVGEKYKLTNTSEYAVTYSLRETPDGESFDIITLQAGGTNDISPSRNANYLRYGTAASGTIVRLDSVKDVKDDYGIFKAAICRDVDNLEDMAEAFFNGDKEDWLFTKTVAHGKNSSNHLLSYLGKTNCTITINGSHANTFTVQAKNKATGSLINLAVQTASPVTLPFTFVNPRPELELIDLTIYGNSVSTEDNLTISVTKETPFAKVSMTQESMVYIDVPYDVLHRYIKTNVSIGDVVDVNNPIMSYGYKYNIVSVHKGQKVKITGRGGNASRLWAFTDADYKLVSVSASDLTATDLVLVAPVDGYCISNIFDQSAFAFGIETLITTPYLLDKVNDLHAYVDFTHISDLPFTPYYDASFKFEGDAIGYISSSDTYALYDELMARYPDYITKTDLGTDATGLHLYRYDFVPTYPSQNAEETRYKVLLVSGTHPEYKAIRTLYKVMESICDRWQSDPSLEALRFNVHFIVVPIQNPWGVNNTSRVNSNGVDIARNFPTYWQQGTYVTPPSSSSTYGGTAPLSEKEAQYVYQILQDNKDIVLGVDFHNQYSPDVTFWIPAVSTKMLGLANALIKQTDRRTRRKFTYIPSSYNIGMVDRELPGGTLGNEVSHMGILGCTFETCDNNITGYTNDNDIITISHDAFINFLILCLRYSK